MMIMIMVDNEGGDFHDRLSFVGNSLPILPPSLMYPILGAFLLVPLCCGMHLTLTILSITPYFRHLHSANLSNDYFTNRQDRCIVIRDCAALSHYFLSLITAVSQFSYQLDRDDSTCLHESCVGDPTKSEIHSCHIVILFETVGSNIAFYIILDESWWFYVYIYFL